MTKNWLNLKLAMGIVAFLCFNYTQAQNSWIELHNVDGVVISYQYADCDMNWGFDEEDVLLKIENTNSYEVLVDWDVHLWYDNECMTCDDPLGEYHRTEKFAAGEAVEGYCSEECPQTYRLFSKFIDENYKNIDTQVVLTQFELNNVKVTDLSEE